MRSIAAQQGTKLKVNAAQAQPSILHAPGVEPPLLGTHLEPSYGVFWIYLKPESPSKFTPALISTLRAEQLKLEKQVKDDLKRARSPSINYQVFSSDIPGIFNLGGDLEFLRRRIAEEDREGLRRYARNCVDLTYSSATHFKLPITTISLVQGTAMGGGFEAALANDVVVAEKGCKMGMPEILFNLFPGMGAYHLLSRRLPPAKAEQLILSGRTYTSEELFEMGIVDILAEVGEGEDAVWEYIKKVHGRSHGRNALRSVIQKVDRKNLNYDNFIEVVDIWVDAAFELSDSDLRTMDLLLRSQKRISSSGK